MPHSQKVIIVYDNKALSSYLWMNNGQGWYLFPFMEGRDLYPCLRKKFTIENSSFDSLPPDLRKVLKADGFHEDIKAIFCL